MKFATSMPRTSDGFCDAARTHVFHLRESRPSRVNKARPADHSPRKWVSSRATSLRACMLLPYTARVAYQEARCNNGTASCSEVDQWSRDTDRGGRTNPGIVSTVRVASNRSWPEPT